MAPAQNQLFSPPFLFNAHNHLSCLTYGSNMKVSCLWSSYSVFKTTPIDVVCLILKTAAIEDRAMAVVLLRVSKAIYNLVLPILYDTVRLPCNESRVASFTSWFAYPYHIKIPGCLRPSIRYLNAAMAPLYEDDWRNLTKGMPEIKHLCLTMLDLQMLADCLEAKSLHPSHWNRC
ncbi:hypothetical protein MVEN_01351200 [Mycena venus]|uniref:Uncharacterized protein n=1 Tax=Mycena venus TaxID=2733690 RepID=A0A8H7CW75_9AGAR|nr:hypothetical protein MVEN_01351200 [Mycena venus]